CGMEPVFGPKIRKTTYKPAISSSAKLSHSHRMPRRRERLLRVLRLYVRLPAMIKPSIKMAHRYDNTNPSRYAIQILQQQLFQQFFQVFLCLFGHHIFTHDLSLRINEESLRDE